MLNKEKEMCFDFLFCFAICLFLSASLLYLSYRVVKLLHLEEDPTTLIVSYWVGGVASLLVGTAVLQALGVVVCWFTPPVNHPFKEDIRTELRCLIEPPEMETECFVWGYMEKEKPGLAISRVIVRQHNTNGQWHFYEVYTTCDNAPRGTRGRVNNLNKNLNSPIFFIPDQPVAE